MGAHPVGYKPAKSTAAGEAQAPSAGLERVSMAMPPSMTGRAGRVLAVPASMQGLILPVVLLFLWELLGHLQLLPRGMIPPPSAVAKGWYNWTFGEVRPFDSYSGTWLSNVFFSSERVLKGYLLAIAVGAPLGVIIGWSRWFARVVDPTVQSLRPIPITAWLPFTIALFGIRDFGAVFLIALGAFYPIVVNSTFGARDVNKNLVRAAQMMGASRRYLLFRVIFPNALPAVFTGMRIGLGIAWAAVIIAEMIAVKSGLGYVLWDAYYLGRMDVVIADMATIGLLGFMSDRIVVWISGLVCGWKHQQQG
ncbi:ABC transporter permease [soil metagenome]